MNEKEIDTAYEQFMENGESNPGKAPEHYKKMEEAFDLYLGSVSEFNWKDGYRIGIDEGFKKGYLHAINTGKAPECLITGTMNAVCYRTMIYNILIAMDEKSLFYLYMVLHNKQGYGKE